MQLTREAIQRMVGDRMGGGGTGGGGGISAAMLAGYATESWVNDNYLSIEFFSKLFKAYDSAATPNEVQPNDTESTITNIKAMFGFWTAQYISALGQNGTAQGSTIAVSDLVDVQLSSPTNGQVLMWDATNSKWVNGTVQGGGGGGSTAWADIIGKPTTIAGYGITDAKIQNGTITLGGNSITPLTQHQAVSGTFWGRSWSNGGTVSGAIYLSSHLYMNASAPNTGGKGLMVVGYESSGTEEKASFGFHAANSDSWATNALSMQLILDSAVDAVASKYTYIYGGLRIGNGMILWDSTNNAFKLIKADGTSASIYATGSVSALGLSAGVSSVDVMTFGTLNVTDTLKVKKGIHTNDIYTNSSGKLYIESNAGTWIEGGMTVNDSNLDMSGESNLNMNGNRIYLTSTVYLHTNGSDLLINISGTEYKLTKTTV